jgi:glycosyltransferase involved in cell wall biosynthesis
MTSVVVAPTDVAMFPEGGGHFWVYLQWVRGLERLGCEVWWLEHVGPTRLRAPDDNLVARFLRTAADLGLAERVILYTEDPDGRVRYFNREADAEAVLRRADLLLNFRYRAGQEVLARCRRTALVDIDPGLLQFWVDHGQIDVQPHDLYFTTGPANGSAPPGAPAWIGIRPVVDLPSWPYRGDPSSDAFTTVTNWFAHEWLSDGKELLLDNSKRAGFLPFASLPERTAQPLELAIPLADTPDEVEDRRLLERCGWRIRHAWEVAGDPMRYRAYIQASRGEFSCVKPSCLLFGHGWVSDRTLCYLASGRPAVVQDTGPNPWLAGDEGLLRFSTVEEAAAALDTVNGDYRRHARAARELVEAHFDARDVAAEVLEAAL